MTVLELKKLIEDMPDNTEIKIEGTNIVDDAYFWYNGGHIEIKEVTEFGKAIILLVPDY